MASNKPPLVRVDYMIRGMFTLEHLASKRAVANVLNGQDLPAAVLRHPSALVLLRDVAASYIAAARHLGIDDLGTQIAKHTPFEQYGLIGEYAIQGDTLGDGLRRLFELVPFEIQGLDVWQNEDESRAIVLLSSRLRELTGWHHIINVSVCQIVNLCRHYAGNEWCPDWIDMDYPARFKSLQFEEFMSCPVRYGADASSIVFPSEDLALRSPQSLDSTGVLILSDVMRLNQPTIPSDFRGLVASQIVQRLLDGQTDRDGLAAKLGLGARTLQRRLERAGTSYSELLDEVRRNRAHALLSDTTLTVGQISQALGYTQSEHFTRAFRRWFGVAPTQYREAPLD